MRVWAILESGHLQNSMPSTAQRVLLVVPDFDFYYILRIGDKDGPMIGGVSVAQRGASVPPDMGWCILEPHMGKGYATEGAKEFLRYLREDFGLQEIMVWQGSTNRESRRVAYKLGFVEGGNVRSAEEPGTVDVVYVLPGMKFKDLTLSMLGDEGIDWTGLMLCLRCALLKRSPAV
jgi:RimJ/RimL family protein N-acetyltransferase